MGLTGVPWGAHVKAGLLADFSLKWEEGMLMENARPHMVAAHKDMEQAMLDETFKSIAIPPRPSVLLDLQTEMRRPEPDFSEIVRLVNLDVAMTALVIKTVNSPFYGLNRKAGTVDQAVSLIGLKQLMVIVTGYLTRQSLRGDPKALTRFLDTAGKRSYAMSRLARGTRRVEPDVAQSFGLFCDIGIPLLLNRFPTYGQTLKLANEDASRSFTEIEQAAHHTDHALVGAMMARSWGLSSDVCLAIRLHHDYSLFDGPAKSSDNTIEYLVAMALVADLAIQRFAGLASGLEWAKAGERAVGALMFSAYDVEDWIDTLLEGFASGAA